MISGRKTLSSYRQKAEILDVIELNSPFSIASASLDTTIRIFSLVDNEDISVLREHQKGVKQLSYNPNFGGFILSVGFERNVYVWSPEVTTKKSLIGKLEGHTEIVSYARFLNFKPFCVSVDEKFNFRFWDVRQLSCVQVITNEINAQVPVYGLFVIPNQERFIVFSKRLLFYDTENEDKVNQAKDSSGDVNPLMAEFNQYYLNFAIMTHHDIRIYNAKDGKLQKIIQNIQDPKTKSPLTAFCLDDKQRKIYVGDSAGAIRTYNISNGVFIKNVQKPFAKKKQQIFDLVNEMDSHEISMLKFLNLENHESLMLVSSSWDSSLQIFDEEQPDESHLLRLSVGGHGNEDICCMSVSPDLNLIATGSCSGILAVWDFESNKVESYLIEHNKQISSLHFLYPLALLISTCNEGFACIWGMKQAPLDYRYKLLQKIRNNLQDPEMCFLNINITTTKIKFLKTDKTFSHPLMMVGDEAGYINKWDLTSIVKKFRDTMGFKDIQSISKYKLSFNPKKNAQVNAGSSAPTLIFFAQQKQQKVKAINSERSVKQQQWYAHKGQLNSINFLEYPDGIITCSVDKHVKLWSLDGILWGDINLMKENYDKHWSYPFDWSEKKVKEIERVKVLMSVVDHPPPEGIKEDVIFDHKQKKEKDKRELIDYLSKRQRRIDLEENIKRQHERQIILQNQEQMRAQYVSQQMQYSEKVYSENFRLEAYKATEERFQGVKSGLVLAMDTQFQQIIDNSDKLLRGQSRQSDAALFDINSPTSTVLQKKLSSTKTMRSSLDNNKLMDPKSPMNSNIVASPSHINHHKNLKVAYPKPIPPHLRKDKNKEFNAKIFDRIYSQQSIQTLDMLTSSQQTKDPKSPKVTFNQSSIQNFNLYDPPQEIKTTIKYEKDLKPFTPASMNPSALKSSINNMRAQVKNASSSHNQHLDSTTRARTSISSAMEQFRPQSHQGQYSSTQTLNDHYKTNKLALKQKTTSLKIAHLSQNVNKYGRRFELASQNGQDTQESPQQQLQSVQSAKQLTSPKQRRILIGMDGSHSSSKFLKKLNNFISMSTQPQSKQSDNVQNIRYAKGEGARLLKVSYNDVQVNHRVLHTAEFGYKRKQPEPVLKNIFDDEFKPEN